jgi:hypothetical protein
MAALAWLAKWSTLLSDGEGVFEALDPRLQMLKLLLLLFHEQVFNSAQSLFYLIKALVVVRKPFPIHTCQIFNCSFLCYTPSLAGRLAMSNEGLRQRVWALLSAAAIVRA